MTEQHLWEAEHSYYCSTTKENGTDHIQYHKSWIDFIETEGDADFDWNLLFRWDWEPPREDEGLGPIKWQGDENYRDSKLHLFWASQRLGYLRCSVIEVCRADESAIKEWLAPRFQHLLGLWSPLTTSTGD